MRHKVRALVFIGLLVGLVTGLGTVAPLAASGAAGGTGPSVPFCGITWGSLPKTAGTLSQAPLFTTRTGQDTCWDRVVFEFDGAANGYDVRYGEVYTEGRGLAMSPYTAGGALLGVHLRAPTSIAVSGEHVANVLGYQTLRDVVFGGSFEGNSTFAVGVRATLPFRVFVLSGPGTHSRIVLDVAHRWEQ
jgi:hypothetical protein